MKGTLRGKTKSLVDSMLHYADRPRFRRCFEDNCRYSLDDVIDDTVSYYNLIGVSFGLMRICIDNRRRMSQFKYNNDIRTLRDFV